MTFHITRRGFIRLICFSIAILVVLSIFAFFSSAKEQKSRRALEYHYLQSISDLTTYAQNIDSTLTKAMYTATPTMLSSLCSKLWRESSSAKTAIDALPVDYLELQNTNKFLSQLGEYCVSLANSVSRGEEITAEQRQSLEQLREYCDTMLNEVLTLNDGVATGAISLASVEGNLNRSFDKAPQSASVADGFSEFEEGFSAYPTLIYDGPFSDHILQKEPEMLKNVQNATREEARKKAAKVSGNDPAAIQDSNDEDGKMASYGFRTEDTDISITKKGGYLCYLLHSRSPKEAKLSQKEAIVKANAYLADLGIENLTTTYYETGSNIMTINYACLESDVTIYTDLVKISVAMDNGEILGFDARGYLTNHAQRSIPTPSLSRSDAATKISPYLTAGESKLCVIPSAGLNEVFCWEFLCKSKDGQNVLVYINAETGMEEQILILYIDENGQLTL